MNKIVDFLLIFVAFVIVVVIFALYLVKKVGVLEMSMIEIAGIVGALTAIAAIIYRIYKKISTIVKSIMEVGQRISNVELANLRLEYLILKQNDHNNFLAIKEIYEAYHSKGGNTYITADYNKYLNEREHSKNTKGKKAISTS